MIQLVQNILWSVYLAIQLTLIDIISPKAIALANKDISNIKITNNSVAIFIVMIVMKMAACLVISIR